MVKCCSENLKGWWNSFSNGYDLFSLPITSIVTTYSKPTSTSASTLPCNGGALSHTVARGNALKIMCIETRITTHISALCSQLHHHLLRSHRRGSCTPTAHMFSHTLSGVHLCSSTGWLVYVSAYWRKIKTHTHTQTQRDIPQSRRTRFPPPLTLPRLPKSVHRRRINE